MKILLSGGMKTKNIVAGVAKKFQASGDEFIVIEFIDNINDIYAKGDYYDKAIITEQSITREYSITDETEIRNRVNMFAEQCAQRDLKQSFVFLTQEEYMANLIYEEILPISRNSAVVLQKPPYSVGFFHNIIVTDVNQLASDIVFEPEAIRATPSFDETAITEVNDEFINNQDLPTEFAPNQIDNPDDIFGLELDTDGNSNMMSDELPIDTGESLGTDNDNNNWDNEEWQFDGEQPFDNNGFGNEQSFDNNGFGNEQSFDNNGFDNMQSFGDEQAFDNDGFDNIQSFEDENFNNTQPFEGENFNNTQPFGDEQMFGNDQQFDTSNNFENNSQQFGSTFGGNTEINTDAEFNSFNEGQQPTIHVDITKKHDEDINIDNIQPIQQSGPLPDYSLPQGDDVNNNGIIPGFDDDEYNTDSEQESLYGDFVPDSTSQFNDDMYNDNNTEACNVEMNGPLKGFDDEDYGIETSTNEEQTQNVGNMPMGFDVDDYIQENNQQQYNNDQSNISAMAAGAVGAITMMSEDLHNQQMNQQVNNAQKPVTKKKGFFGKGQQSNNMGQPIQNQPSNQQAMMHPRTNIDAIKSRIQPFAARGNSIVVTGCGGCGTSTIAYNLANIVAQLGYTALIVDMDTEGRTQSYISKLNYESMDADSANLMSAINSSTGIGNYTSVVKPGLHLLTMGIAADTAPVNELIHKEKISRFVNLAKTSYNFVIYDIPFESAVGYLSEMVYMSSNIVLVTDASNWGITKTLLSMCNIASDEMQDIMFNRGQLVFNKYRRLSRVFGKKVKTCTDITKAMDQRVLELIGEDVGLHFDSMHIAGIINDDPDFEDGWYSDIQYSDTAKGQDIFIKLLSDIVLTE